MPKVQNIINIIIGVIIAILILLVILIILLTYKYSPGQLSYTPNPFPTFTGNVGTTVTNSLTISNSGGGTITITEISYTGAGFSATAPSVPFTLSSQQSATIAVNFSPLTTSQYSGALVIVYTPSTQPLQILLNGIGTGTAGNSYPPRNGYPRLNGNIF